MTLTLGVGMSSRMELTMDMDTYCLVTDNIKHAAYRSWANAKCIE